MSLFNWGCALPEDDFYMSLLFSTLLPVCGLGIVWITYALAVFGLDTSVALEHSSSSASSRDSTAAHAVRWVHAIALVARRHARRAAYTLSCGRRFRDPGTRLAYTASERRRRFQWRSNAITASLLVLFVTYPNVSSEILRTFPCTTYADGSTVLNADPSVSCTTPQYGSYSAYAAFMTATWVAGVPVVYTAQLWWYRDRLDPRRSDRDLDLGEDVADRIRRRDKRVAHLRFLFGPYRTGAFWFEVFETVRKLAQTSVLLFVAPGTALQMTYQLALSAVVIVVISGVRPYRGWSDLALALTAQWLIFITTFLAFIINEEQRAVVESATPFNMEAVNTALVVLFALMPVATAALIVYDAALWCGVPERVAHWWSNRVDGSVDARFCVDGVHGRCRRAGGAPLPDHDGVQLGVGEKQFRNAGVAVEMGAAGARRRRRGRHRRPRPRLGAGHQGGRRRGRRRRRGGGARRAFAARIRARRFLDSRARAPRLV